MNDNMIYVFARFHPEHIASGRKFILEDAIHTGQIQQLKL